MDIQQGFYLQGIGILENIIRKQDKFIAQIRAMNIAGQDEIYLDCIIPNIFQDYLFNLFPQVKAGHQLLLTFVAEYEQFEVAFPYPNDKDCEANIIIVRCKITAIHNWVIRRNSLNICNFP